MANTQSTRRPRKQVIDDKRCICGHSNISHDNLGPAATGKCRGSWINRSLSHAPVVINCDCQHYTCATCGEVFP